jgi:hypothetical protein
VRELRWLTRYGPEGASARYRAYRVAENLAEFGWESTLEPLAAWRAPATHLAMGPLKRMWRLSGLAGRAQTTALIVQKEPLMPPVLFRDRLLRELRRTDRPLIWDVDDAVWLGSAPAHRMAVRMCQLSDVVVAGNHLIADWARSNGAEARVIPTCYQPKIALDPDPSAPGAVRLLWVGSPATAALLEPWAPLFDRILRALPDVWIRFVGGVPPASIRAHPRVESLDWSPEIEAEALHWADYGLALQDRTPYNDHKCGFKLVQYMSHGVVPLAVRNPVHETMLGGVGLLIEGAEQADDVCLFVTEPPSSSQVHAARNRWQSLFSEEAAAREWDLLLRTISQEVFRHG